jgi:hypothetical protein
MTPSDTAGHRRWTSEQKWAPVRLILGNLQIAGATGSFILLAQRGVTPATLAVVVTTSLCTTVSVLRFGGRS